jgi:hypothetical protein
VLTTTISRCAPLGFLAFVAACVTAPPESLRLQLSLPDATSRLIVVDRRPEYEREARGQRVAAGQLTYLGDHSLSIAPTEILRRLVVVDPEVSSITLTRLSFEFFESANRANPALLLLPVGALGGAIGGALAGAAAAATGGGTIQIGPPPRAPGANFARALTVRVSVEINGVNREGFAVLPYNGSLSQEEAQRTLENAISQLSKVERPP